MAFFALRALVGGLLVASLPALGGMSNGTRLAGLAVLFPAVTLVGWPSATPLDEKLASLP